MAVLARALEYQLKADSSRQFRSLITVDLAIAFEDVKFARLGQKF
jgi:hypothetical protein